MSNAINNLFTTEANTLSNNNRSLSGTAQLTSVASDIAAKVISVMNNDIDNYVDDIKRSQTDNDFMDSLIERIHPLAEVDVEFLKDLSEETLDGMLKSQQSKRSRCKSKAMTLDNYKSLMVGAIAENLIRLATGKEKHAVGSRRVSGSIEYTVEELEMLNNDQDKLRKEIRNIQSKKSIMKSKADFDENSERWQQLLKVEQQLKDMRVGTTVEYIDTTRDKLTEMLNGADMQSMTAKDSKALLEQIAEMIRTED